jgi:type II secretory pathway pseudopilin PulG
MKEHNLGFTLVEMAMVLFIVTLLLASLVPTISAQLEQQRTNETRKQLNEIQEALIGYAIVNGRLPCPAKATLVTTFSNAGKEATYGNDCACVAAGNPNADTSMTACTLSSVTGVLPWVTLGLKETDAWDHRFTYRVTKRFADQIAAGTTDCSPALSTPPVASSFALCSPGGTNVLSAYTGGTSVAANVPAIIVSHGKNGAGAYIHDGSKLADGTGDELENSDGDSNFVSHNTTSSFDDMTAWIVPGILFNRMITAGKLP